MSIFQDAFNKGLELGVTALDDAEQRLRFIARAFVHQTNEESPYNHPQAREKFDTLALALMEGLKSLGPYEIFERKEFDATADKSYKRNLVVQTISTIGNPFHCQTIATISLISPCKNSSEFKMEYRTEGYQPFISGIAQNQFATVVQAHKVDVLSNSYCVRVIQSKYAYTELDKALEHMATLLSITIRGKEREVARRKLSMQP